MKMAKLPVIITQDEDGYYVAEVPLLQSCFTQGKTREEALENIKDVIKLCLEHMHAEGIKLPDKYTIEQIEVPV